MATDPVVILSYARTPMGGMQGALAFVKDQQGVFNFKLVDLSGTRGIIWEHELYEGFEYFQDRPFFHSFAGDVGICPIIP